MTSDSILLVQTDPQNADTKVFSYHRTVEQAVSKVLNIYEHRLKLLNPQVQHLSYTLKDIHSFIDRCPEFGILIFDSRMQAYVPHGKDWIKERVAEKLVRN